MSNYLETFKSLLEGEKKEEALHYTQQLLKNKEVDLISLYTEILTPALNSMECKLADKNICIWQEHVRTAIVRTIVECAYPYVIEMKQQKGYGSLGTAVVLCPPEEYHDLGARMVADFLEICGFDTTFVGSNTPIEDFYNAMYVIKPKVVAISVSNYYNLVSAKKLIHYLKGSEYKEYIILVGGHAFERNQDSYKMVGADYYVHNFQDMERIIRNEVIQ